jgi:hypothetical protein
MKLIELIELGRGFTASSGANRAWEGVYSIKWS